MTQSDANRVSEAITEVGEGLKATLETSTMRLVDSRLELSGTEVGANSEALRELRSAIEPIVENQVQIVQALNRIGDYLGKISIKMWENPAPDAPE